MEGEAVREKVVERGAGQRKTKGRGREGGWVGRERRLVMGRKREREAEWRVFVAGVDVTGITGAQLGWRGVQQFLFHPNLILLLLLLNRVVDEAGYRETTFFWSLCLPWELPGWIGRGDLCDGGDLGARWWKGAGWGWGTP